MAEPLLVEIVTYAPTAFYHCTHCEVAWHEAGLTHTLHGEQVASSLPPDLADDYQAISDWVRGLIRRHGNRVAVQVIDAASIAGFLASLRYRLHHYPTIVVDHRNRFSGDPVEALSAAAQAIERRLVQPASC